MAKNNRKFIRLYVACVVAAGGTVLLSSLYELIKEPLPHEWMLLAGLTLLSFFLAVKVPGVPAKMSVSETFVFATVLLFGTAAATVTVAIDALIMSGWRQRRDPLKLLFNATEPTLSIWIASQLFFSLIGEPLRLNPRDGTALLLPVLVLSLTYFFLNSSLTALVISLESGGGAAAVLRSHFSWLALNYLGGASIAVLIVQNTTTVSVATISIILPVLIITYLTFKSTMGRIEDANSHVSQLNRLYLSTIETLAMAVDAKDQITHGHIRRVQNHAISLAKAVGLHDRELIRALEAAALLHDIGKLAVPESILNKPGKLDAAEFESIKVHASLGADILSAAEFPYPVVPIVRHHHENWDGTGYPDRLSGVEIPIGARLLAVVDCFDALTSDRPYRKRMSRSEALDILRQRSGSMYDPHIVETFIKSIDQIAPAEDRESAEARAASSRYDRKSLPVELPSQKASGQATELRQKAIKRVLSEFASQMDLSLSDYVPNSIFVLYVLDPSTNRLVALNASHDVEGAVLNFEIPFAQQLSGWVAANRQTVMNSDPTLDFGELCNSLSVNHALCTPIVAGTILFGVLAVYRRSHQFFTTAEAGHIEALSRTISSALSECISETSHALIARPAPAKASLRQAITPAKRA